jgi:tRNA modification GTPase
MSAGDTIFAVSTGAGMAGIAVIRVSGPKALEAAERIAGKRPGPRVAARRHFRHPISGGILDDGLLVVFPEPESFTGEDVVEFHCHGGLAVQRALLGAVGSIDGLRAAEPGEFSRRAFRNGRMDLMAAEGLGDLIRARSESQRRQALHHALGRAGDEASAWRRQLIGLLGRVEAAVDFIDEAHVAEEALRGVRDGIAALMAAMEAALADAERGEAIREGVKVVIAGPPNAGKSSLLNALAKREAAIVSDIPGTTRDVIEVMLDIGAVPVILTDTAGLRDGGDDPLESVGMERARREIGAGDLVVWVTAPDAVSPPPIDSDTIWIGNKADLDGIKPEGPHYLISAKTGAGMAEFLLALEDRVHRLAGATEPPVLIRQRHKLLAMHAVSEMKMALGYPPEQIELVAERLRGAAYALGRLTGTIDVEDVLDSIFREFCIGK